MVSKNALIQYAKKVKNSEIIEEDGLGHLMHEEEPQRIVQHLKLFYDNLSN